MAIKRHETECPLEKINLVKQLIDMWENGWLDDFSDKHFLIRAIYGDKSVEKKLAQHYQAGAPELYYMKSNVTLTFCVNLAMKIKSMCNVFGENNIKNFVKNQLSAGKKHYDESTFFEALAEIEILIFFIRFGPGEVEGIYEPRCGKGNCNPEASLKYSDGTRIDIEVKTPEFRGNCRGMTDIYMPLHCLTQEGLYYNVNGIHKRYITDQLRKIINENRV